MTAATLPAFLTRITARTAHLGIIGLGYVGLLLTLLFSEERFRVTGLYALLNPPTPILTLSS